MMRSHLLASFLFILVLQVGLISAVGIDNPNLPIVKTEPVEFPTNITVNVTVDAAENWDTLDRGKLDRVSDIMHSWVSGLQGGSSGEYYHLNQSVFDYLMANIFGWVTSDEVDAKLANIHDQDLNTTNNVSFVEVKAQVGNFTDLYVSNETIYIGDVKLSSNNITLNISSVGTGITTVSSDFFEGDGSRLKNINLSSVNQTAVFEQDVTIEGDLIVNGTTTQLGDVNITGTLDMKDNHIINAIYDWTAEAPWLNFNGTYLYFNETKLQDETEVVMQEEVTVIPIAGGAGSATTGVLDFEIKEIDVECTAGMNFRFEASETTSGDIIDRDRKQHTTDWRIEKNYPIDDTVDLDITSTNPATGSCTVTIKYLNNFD